MGAGEQANEQADELSTADYTVRALGPDTWDAFAALAEKHNGVWGGCWCNWFHRCAEELPQMRGRDRAYKEDRVRAGTAHAALVFDGDVAIGWAEYGPPEELPNIHHRKEYLRTAEMLPDYRITCLFVDRDHRREGVARRAAEGAISLIAAAGGGVVESYPHDLPPGSKKSSSFLYNATRSMYEGLGFTYDRPKGLGNCVMRTTVPPAIVH
jgi:GNAT superfamily N-acetyltransferase